MKVALRIGSYLAGLPLEMLVIAALLRAPWRRFPIVFGYMIVFFVATVVETASFIAGYFGDRRARDLYVASYWFDERLLLGLVFLVVISFIYRATIELQSRRIVRSVVVGAAAVFAAVTFWSNYNPSVLAGEWITPWTSNLNFGAAILDLALWAILLGARVKDRQLLLLSGALGIQFAGQAIGESIRHLAQNTRSAPLSISGGIVIILANMAFLYIWFQAFRRPAGKSRAAAA